MKTSFEKSISALITIILAFITLELSAHENQEPGAIPDSVTVKAKESKHSLYANAGLGYNMLYMGTSLSQDKPYFSGGVIYGFREELFLSVSGYHLNAYDAGVAFSTYSLIYSHTFNSWFDISLSASRYQVNKNLTDTLFTSFYYGDITLGFDWNLLYTKISAGGLFSESSAAYFQLRNSRFFKTSDFINGKAYLSFDPYVNLLFGVLTETSDGTVVSPPFHKGKSGGGSSSTTSTKFSLIEVDLGIPISFNIGKFTIDAEPGYAYPLYTDTSSGNTSGFTFNIGLYFRIL
jgi:hypothetical protein